MKESRVSLKDIANEAGVSIATVSYILNEIESQSFSSETIKKVNDAAKKLGYIPSMVARTLVSNRSMMIGVVIPQIEQHKEFMFSNPFYGDFLSSVEYAARQAGYHILLSGTNTDQTYLEVARTRSLDGIIIVGLYPEEYYEDLKKSGIPVVLVDSYCADRYFHSIKIDDYKGGYIATKHLIDNGHNRIVHVTGLIKEDGVNYQRMLGWRQALEENGIEYDPALLFDGEVSFTHGLLSGVQLASCFKDTGVTAVFVSADIMALGLYTGLRTGGVSIPSDISVVSFDDTWIAGTCDPKLTTVHQDVFAKGKAAAETILSILNDDMPSDREVTLPISLAERNSVCRR